MTQMRGTNVGESPNSIVWEKAEALLDACNVLQPYIMTPDEQNDSRVVCVENEEVLHTENNMPNELIPAISVVDDTAELSAEKTNVSENETVAKSENGVNVEGFGSYATGSIGGSGRTQNNEQVLELSDLKTLEGRSSFSPFVENISVLATELPDQLDKADLNADVDTQNRLENGFKATLSQPNGLASFKIELNHTPCLETSDARPNFVARAQTEDLVQLETRGTSSDPAEISFSHGRCFDEVETPRLLQGAQGSSKEQAEVVNAHVKEVQPSTCIALGRLLELLDQLSNLDTEKFFQEPVDEQNDAPGYSSVVLFPLDFGTFRRRLEACHKIKWQSFVDDFELICSNAMAYNRKGSRVHKAAGSLFRQGRRLLQHHEDEFLHLLDSCCCFIDDLPSVGSRVLLKPGEEDLTYTQVRVDDACCEETDISDEDSASDSSSSFGSAGSELEEEILLRDITSFQAGLPQDDSTTSNHQRIPVSAEWKRAKRDIEWRCRWLKLRMQDLNRQSQHYEELERRLMSLKANERPPGATDPQQQSSSQPTDHNRGRDPSASLGENRRDSGEAASSAARVSLPFSAPSHRTQVLKRRRRKLRRQRAHTQAQEHQQPSPGRLPSGGQDSMDQDLATPLDQPNRLASSAVPEQQEGLASQHTLMDLGFHPVLSRLCQKARRKRARVSGMEALNEQPAALSPEEMLALKQQLIFGVMSVDDVTSSEEDCEASTIALWEKCNELERRVIELKAQLSSVQASQSKGGGVSATPKGRGPGRPPGSLSKSKAAIRKKNMLQGELAAGEHTYVASAAMGSVPQFTELVPHLLINTPSVRDLLLPVSDRQGPAALAVALASASSDEDTDSDTYESRHREFEKAERSSIVGLLPGRDKGRKNSRGVGTGRGRGRGSKRVNNDSVVGSTEGGKNASEDKAIGQRVESNTAASAKDHASVSQDAKRPPSQKSSQKSSRDISQQDDEKNEDWSAVHTEAVNSKLHCVPQVVTNSSWKVAPSPRGPGSLKLVLKRTKPH